MRQDSNRQVDPIEREIKVALRPGAFIPDGECFSFVSGLEAVATKIEQLIQSDPGRARFTRPAAPPRPMSWTTRAAISGSSQATLFVGSLRHGAPATQTVTRPPPCSWLGWTMIRSRFFMIPLVDAFDRSGLAAFESRVRSHFQALATLAPSPGALPGEIQGASHFATEPAARVLEDDHPELAARLWRHRASGSSTRGRVSITTPPWVTSHEPKAAMSVQAGPSSGSAPVRFIGTRHFRKTGFISEFRAVVSGTYSAAPPSFLDRAKDNWRKRYGSPTS